MDKATAKRLTQIVDLLTQLVFWKHSLAFVLLWHSMTKQSHSVKEKKYVHPNGQSNDQKSDTDNRPTLVSLAWISSDYFESLLLPQGENDSKQSDEFQAIF